MEHGSQYRRTKGEYIQQRVLGLIIVWYLTVII
jgi:hypothetical protein